VIGPTGGGFRLGEGSLARLLPRVSRLLLSTAIVVAGGWRPRGVAAQTSSVSSIAQRYHAVADSLMGAALADSTPYQRLRLMTDTFGNRPSGSPQLERAIDWVLGQMRIDGLVNVRGEQVMVPHWVRGQESAELLQPRPLPLHLLGLGGSVGTPPAGITAPVLVVDNFDELTRPRPRARSSCSTHPWPPTDRPSRRTTTRCSIE
jgi:hypothetical protein